MTLYLVLTVKTKMDVHVMGKVETIPLSSAGLCGVCPVFNTKEEADAFANGKAQVITVNEVTL